MFDAENGLIAPKLLDDFCIEQISLLGFYRQDLVQDEVLNIVEIALLSHCIIVRSIGEFSPHFGFCTADVVQSLHMGWTSIMFSKKITPQC
jgi:hypothetical protein